MGRFYDLALRAAEKPKRADTHRDRARAAFPFATEKLDELRALFGDGVKVVYAREGDREAGVPLQSHQTGVQAAEPSATTPIPDCDCAACSRKRKALLPPKAKKPKRPDKKRQWR